FLVFLFLGLALRSFLLPPGFFQGFACQFLCLHPFLFRLVAGCLGGNLGSFQRFLGLGSLPLGLPVQLVRQLFLGLGFCPCLFRVPACRGLGGSGCIGLRLGDTPGSNQLMPRFGQFVLEPLDFAGEFVAFVCLDLALTAAGVLAFQHEQQQSRFRP